MDETKDYIYASGYTSGGMEWRLEGDTLYLDGGDFIGGTIMPWAPYRDQIRAVEIRGWCVDVCPDAFANCTALEYVRMDNIEEISQGAFRGCTALGESFYLPEFLEWLYEDAFRGCTSLTSVIFPEYLWQLGPGAFRDCRNLSTVVINEGLLHDSPSCAMYEGRYDEDTRKLNIADVFPGCWNLKTILLPPGYQDVTVDMEDVTVFSIPRDHWPVFHYELCNFTPESIRTTFWRGTYRDGEDPANFRIPDGITKIDNKAFLDFTHLTSITIPSCVKTIGQYAFSGCSNLTSVTLEEGLEEIGSSAFADCVGLTSIYIPSSVQSIHNSAFSGCSSLREIFIPNTVALIGDNAFEHCTQVVTLTIEDAMPDAFRVIGDEAFMGCTSLTQVTIPDGLPWIGKRIFKDCTGLREATISRTVMSFDESVFEGCTSLEKIFETEGSDVFVYS